MSKSYAIIHCTTIVVASIHEEPWKTIVSLVSPFLLFKTMALFSGLKGAAAYTVALATLGGPFGMCGGIFMLLGMSYLINKLLE